MGRFISLSFGFLAGGFARYWLAARVYSWLGTGFPYGTFVVNVSGCLLIGMFNSMVQTRGMLSPEARLLLMTGFCGAYTTFSTLILESSSLAADGQWARALVNYVGSGVLGFALFKVGEALGAAL